MLMPRPTRTATHPARPKTQEDQPSTAATTRRGIKNFTKDLVPKTDTFRPAPLRPKHLRPRPPTPAPQWYTRVSGSL
jgi:hypothetical protein